MKLISKFVAAGIVLAASTFAHATSLVGKIAFNSSDSVSASITSTGVTLTKTGVNNYDGTAAGNLASVTGNFSTINKNDNVNMTANILFSSITPAGLQLFNFVDAGHTYSYSASSYKFNQGDPNLGTATNAVFLGTLYEDGVAINTQSKFAFSNPDDVTPNNFSAIDTNPAPEPSSLILLGTGLVSAAGMVMRKRRVV